jgi:hypothetical protein
MPELKLDANTTVLQLQAFQQSVGNKDEIRAKKNDDGTATLYTHSSGKISLNRDPQKRAEKQQAAYTAVKDFLKGRLGNEAESTALVSKMNEKVPLGKATLDTAILESYTLSVKHSLGIADQKSRVFKELLADPAVRTAFKAFCAKEFASENIEFYEAVEDFNAAFANSAFNVDDLKGKFTEIMDTYVTSIAPKQINLAHKQSEHLVEENRRIQNDPQVTRDDLRQLFDDSRTEIEKLMLSDTWPRFQRSDTFSTALAGKLQNDVAVERARVLEASLRASGLL